MAKSEVYGYYGRKTIWYSEADFRSRGVIMTILSVHSYHIIFYRWFKLWMITTSACSYSWWSFISTCVCPIMKGKGKRTMEICVWPTISIFLGTSCLIFLHGVEGLTWTLDSFPLSPSLSNRSHLIIFALPLDLQQPLPICSFWICINPASFSLSLHLFALSAAQLASVGWCVSFLVCVCVWHASYWTLTINLWPPRSLSVKRSDTK